MGTYCGMCSLESWFESLSEMSDAGAGADADADASIPFL
jgi:hypothetical protein